MQKSDGSDRSQFLDALDCLGFEDGGLGAISRGRMFDESTSSKSVSNDENVESDKEESLSHFKLLKLCWGELRNFKKSTDLTGRGPFFGLPRATRICLKRATDRVSQGGPHMTALTKPAMMRWM